MTERFTGALPRAGAPVLVTMLAVMAVLLPAAASGAARRPVAPAAAPRTPTPIGSPGDWLNPNDYPAAALRHEMAGISAFRLAVDAQGRPGACEITASSGFDVLDQAACERLVRNARFTPAHDAAGRAVAGIYSSRVRWVMPENRKDYRPDSGAIGLTLAEDGSVKGCKVLAGHAGEDEYDGCKSFAEMPADFGRMLRGPKAVGPVEAVIEMGSGYGRGPAVAMAPAGAGYVRALFRFAFTVNAEGRMSECHMVEQRGDPALIQSFCMNEAQDRFNPPFAETGKDGTIAGWSYGRVLVRPAR
jgi:TonB family protein